MAKVAPPAFVCQATRVPDANRARLVRRIHAKTAVIAYRPDMVIDVIAHRDIRDSTASQVSFLFILR